MLGQNNASLLDELVEPLGRCLTPDVARQVIQLHSSPELDAQIQELGRKCNEGQLTPEERADYETITRYVKFISILQSKARALLKDDATD